MCITAHCRSKIIHASSCKRRCSTRCTEVVAAYFWCRRLALVAGHYKDTKDAGCVWPLLSLVNAGTSDFFRIVNILHCCHWPVLLLFTHLVVVCSYVVCECVLARVCARLFAFAVAVVALISLLSLIVLIKC